MMIEKNNIQKWLEGELPTSELPVGEVSGEVVEMVEESARLVVPHTISKEEAWEMFSAKIADEQVEAVVKPLFGRRAWIGAIAASFALLLGIWWVFSPSATEIVSPNGQQITHVLPDGSQVILNAGSRVQYADNWEDQRLLSLEGEAFFDVKKGSTFTVETQFGKVEVLGTSFNVKARDQQLEVGCYTGKVRVTFADEEVVLSPGKAVRKHLAEKAIDYEVEGNQGIEWREGEFIFENAPLSTVVKELERQFDVKIDVRTTKESAYTGYFLNSDLEEALKLVFKTYGLNYTFVNNTHIQVSD